VPLTVVFHKDTAKTGEMWLITTLNAENRAGGGYKLLILRNKRRNHFMTLC